VELTGGADLGSVELAGNAELGGVQEATPREPHGARQQHAKDREGRDDHAKVVAAALRRHAYSTRVFQNGASARSDAWAVSLSFFSSSY
jgi:hypothetical protein